MEKKKREKKRRREIRKFKRMHVTARQNASALTVNRNETLGFDEGNGDASLLSIDEFGGILYFAGVEFGSNNFVEMELKFVRANVKRHFSVFHCVTEALVLVPSHRTILFGTENHASPSLGYPRVG